jgi:hypothetical protein
MTTDMTVHWHALLGVLSNEQLIRFAYRLRKAGQAETARELDDELAKREANGKHD